MIVDEVLEDNHGGGSVVSSVYHNELTTSTSVFDTASDIDW